MATSSSARPSATQNLNLPSSPSMRAFAAAWAANVPAIFESQPGEAKSAKILATLAQTGYARVLTGNSCEVGDFRGLPYEVGEGESRRVVNTAPDFVVEANAAAEATIILDEFNLAEEDIFKLMHRFVQERFSGDHKIAEHVRIVAMQNPVESSTGGVPLPPALANRFLHLPWAADDDEFLRGLLIGFDNLAQPSIHDLYYTPSETDSLNAAVVVNRYLSVNRAAIRPGTPTDPFLAGRAWASMRSWHNLARVLAYIHPADDTTRALVTKGLVGEGAAKEFLAWQFLNDLYDPIEVLKDPLIVQWQSDKPDRLFCAVDSVAALAINRGDSKSWEQAIAVMTTAAKMKRPDIALPAMRALFQRRPKGTSIDMGAVQEHFGELMSRVTHGFATPQPSATGLTTNPATSSATGSAAA